MTMLNKAQLIGNLCADPTVRYTPDGKAITNFNLATNETWKDKNTGEKKSKAEYHRVAIFGKLAEIAGQYLTKGSQVYLEGKLATRKWEKDGVDRYTTEIVIDGFNGQMQMLGGKGESQKPQQAQQAPVDDDFDDSIPF